MLLFLKTKFNDKDVTAIEIVEIEHPKLGGIVSTIQLNFVVSQTKDSCICSVQRECLGD